MTEKTDLNRIQYVIKHAGWIYDFSAIHVAFPAKLSPCPIFGLQTILWSSPGLPTPICSLPFLWKHIQWDWEVSSQWHPKFLTCYSRKST